MYRRIRGRKKWEYAYDCRKCDHLRFIDDPGQGLEGDYCVKHLEREDAGKEAAGCENGSR